MKNTNRILSLIIVLIISLSSLSVYASYIDVPETDIIDDIFRFDVGDFAGVSTDPEISDPDIQRIEVLYTLGLWDDVAKSKNSPVTMSEFSVIMSKIKPYSQDAFLMGFSQNPDKTYVTYKNVFEYLLYVTGYYYKCAHYGYTDESILLAVSEVGLLPYDFENMDKLITRGELAKLVEKAVNIDVCIMEHTDNGEYKYTVIPNKSILNTVHNIRNVSGFVNAVYGLAVYGGASVREGYIQIDRIDLNSVGMDLTKYFGTLVDAYAYFDETNNEYRIIYIDYSAEYAPLEIDFADVVSIRSGSLVYNDEDGMEQQVSLGALKYVIQNGENINSIDNICDYKKNSGKIILTSTDINGSIDTAIIYKYNYYVVAYNNTFENKIGVKFGMKFNGLDEISFDEHKITNVYNTDGTKILIDDIETNDVIRIFRNSLTGYTDVLLEKKKITGTVTSLYDNMIQINDEWFEISADLVNRIDECKTDSSVTETQRVEQITVGSRNKFYVLNNVVVGYDFQNEYKYAYLKSVSQDRTGIDPNLVLKVYTEDREWLDLTVNKKIILDGKSNVSKEDLYTIISNNKDVVINEIVRVKANADNELLALDTILYDDQHERNDSGRVNLVESFMDDIKGTHEWFKIECPYFLTGQTKIFVIPDNKEKTSEYSVVKNTALPADVVLSYDLYSPNEYLQLNVVKVNGTLSSASLDDEYFFFVETIRDVVIDADNQELGKKIIGKRFVPSATLGQSTISEEYFYVSEEHYEANPIDEGDLLRLLYTQKRAKTWTICTSVNEFPQVGFLQKASETGYYAAGEVVAVDSENEMVVIDIDGVETETGRYALIARVKAVVNNDTGKVSNVKMSGFYKGDFIYTFANYGRAPFIMKINN